MAGTEKPWWHGQLTHIPTYQAVHSLIESLVRAKYSGWKAEDREDLTSLVLEKYLQKFGKEAAPENEAREPDLPVAWLRTVISSSATDMHRKDRARPARVVDFNDADGDDDWELIAALSDLRTPSLLTARGVGVDQALSKVAQSHPSDSDLIRWRYVDAKDLATISELTGRSLEATKKAVQRAIARLRVTVNADPELKAVLFDRPEYPIA